MTTTKVSGGSSNSPAVPTDSADTTAQVQQAEGGKLPDQNSLKTQKAGQDSAPQIKRSSSDSPNRTAEMKLTGRYVEASLRNHVETAGGSKKSGDASSLTGMRLGWLKDGSEVKIARDLSPASGHATRMDALAFARLTGKDPAAIVQDREGKWHAVQTDKNFYGGFQAASDNPLRQVEGLAHFDKTQIADLQKQIEGARAKGDNDEVTRLQKSQAALIFGVQDTEINFIRNSSDRKAGVININSGNSGGGMHGAEKSPNSNFDPKKASAMEISLKELGDPGNASGIIFHESSHAKDYALTKEWVNKYETETGRKFVPGDKGDRDFTLWVNNQAPKRLSRADAELVSDVSANANGSSEAKAYVGTFINALKAGNPEAAAVQLKSYAEGMLSKPQKINRPTGANVELELKQQLEAEYRKMPKEMKTQFDQIFKDLAASSKTSDAWISKFKH